MRRRSALTLAGLMALTACSPQPIHQQSIGFGASDVDHLELYVYQAGDEVAQYVDITDKGHIDLWTSHFDNQPLYPPNDQELDFFARGADVHGLRFHLVDGTIWERSHVFFGPGALFVDGNGTALGVARYSSMGTLPLDGSTRVDVSEAPPVRRAA